MLGFMSRRRSGLEKTLLASTQVGFHISKIANSKRDFTLRIDYPAHFNDPE